MKLSTANILKSGVAPLVLGVALLASPAMGQDAVTSSPPPAKDAAPASDTNVIVVTGSRIVLPNLKSIAPITSVTNADIKVSGVTKIEDLLNQLPQVFAAQSSTLSNGATGTATISLRDLGDTRTLVLINGRRLMPGDPSSSAADLNFIPNALLKRVDIETGGASATYGADALAGVVNFVMDTDFTGLRVDLNNGFYQNDSHNTFVQGLLNKQQAAGNSGYGYPSGNVVDGDNFDATVAYGAKFAGGAGHIMVYGGYRHAQAITQNRRDYSACTVASAKKCGGSATSGDGNALYWTPGGTSSTIGALGHGQVQTGSENIYNYAPTNYYQRPDDRYTAGAFANYDAGPAAHLYMELMYMNDHNLAQIAPSGDFGNTQTINCNNPLLTAQESATLCTPDNTVVGYLSTTPGKGFPVVPYLYNNLSADSQALVNANPAAPGTVYFQLLKRNTAGGPRSDDQNHKDFRGVWGSNGELGHGWKYDAYYQYGQVEYSETYRNDVSISALTNALNVVAGPNGPQCASAAAVAAGCVPYDVFSGNGVSQAATNYVTANGRKSGKNTEQVADVSFTGDLGTYGIKSPASENAVIVNLGGEFRRETLHLIPDSEFTTGDLAGQGGATLPISGAFNVFEGIGEVNAPLISHGTSNVLNFEGGFRYSHYKYSGTLYDAYYNIDGKPKSSFDTVTWKLGLTFQPVNDISLRASINRAVRAPDINNKYDVDHVALDGSTDPCSVAASPACVTEGLRPGQVVQSNPAGQYNGLIGGNVNLTPEVGITKSLGVVLTPHQIPGFSLTVDYFDINIKNAIQAIGADTILAACGSAPNSSICGYVHRDPAGSLWLSNNGYVTDIAQNIGGVDTRGFDFNLAYNHKFESIGTVSASLDGTVLDRYLINNGVTPTYDCSSYYGVTCGNPLPVWRHKARVALITPNGLSASLTWRYVGPVKVDYLNPSSSLNDGLAVDPKHGYTIRSYGAHIDGQSYFDFAFSARVTSGFTARIGVNNIFDKDPPLVDTPECASVQCNGNTYPGTYDALGRYIFTSVTLNF